MLAVARFLSTCVEDTTQTWERGFGNVGSRFAEAVRRGQGPPSSPVRAALNTAAPGSHHRN